MISKMKFINIVGPKSSFEENCVGLYSRFRDRV